MVEAIGPGDEAMTLSVGCRRRRRHWARSTGRTASQEGSGRGYGSCHAHRDDQLVDRL